MDNVAKQRTGLVKNGRAGHSVWITTGVWEMTTCRDERLTVADCEGPATVDNRQGREPQMISTAYGKRQNLVSDNMRLRSVRDGERPESPELSRSRIDVHKGKRDHFNYS